MASRPANVPETAKWLLVRDNEASSQQYFSTKAEAIGWLIQARITGDQFAYLLYAPDSRHEFVVANQVVWEKSSG